MTTQQKIFYWISPWLLGIILKRLPYFERWSGILLFLFSILFLCYWGGIAQSFCRQQNSVISGVLTQNMLGIISACYLLLWRMLFSQYPLGFISVMAQEYFLPTLPFVGKISRFLPAQGDIFMVSVMVMIIATLIGGVYGCRTKKQ